MFWRNNGKIITNSDGNLLRCSECPCKLGKGIILYVDTWNKITHQNFSTEKPYTGAVEYYNQIKSPDSQYGILTYNYSWVDTETFLNNSENGYQRRQSFPSNGYIKYRDESSVTTSSSNSHYVYRQWEHDENNWYFNFSNHSGLGNISKAGLFYGQQPIVEDYNIWTVAMSGLISNQTGSIYRTNSVKNPSFAYKYQDKTSWALENFTLNQSFVPFQQDVAPYGTQIVQYYYKFNISWQSALWANSTCQGYCKWTVTVNLRNNE